VLAPYKMVTATIKDKIVFEDISGSTTRGLYDEIEICEDIREEKAAASS
jgi:hypothetical protein